MESTKLFIDAVQPILVLQALFVMSLSAYSSKDAPFISYLGFHLIAHYFLLGSFAIGLIDLSQFIEVYFQVHVAFYFTFYLRYCRNLSEFWMGIVDDIYTHFSFYPMYIFLFNYIYFRVKIPLAYAIKKLNVVFKYSDVATGIHFSFSPSLYILYIVVALMACFTTLLCVQAIFFRITVRIRMIWGALIPYFLFISVFLPFLIYSICSISLSGTFSVFKIVDTKFEISCLEVIFYNYTGFSGSFVCNDYTLGLICFFLFIFLILFPAFIYIFIGLKAESFTKIEEEEFAVALAKKEADAEAEAEAELKVSIAAVIKKEQDALAADAVKLTKEETEALIAEIAALAKEQKKALATGKEIITEIETVSLDSKIEVEIEKCKESKD